MTQLQSALQTVARNLRTKRGLIVFDATVLIAALGLFALITYAIKPSILGTEGLLYRVGITPDSLLGNLLICHAIDLLGGCAFLGYVNLLFDLVKPGFRINNPGVAALFILCCGLFWEYGAPLFVPDATADPWDLVAYVCGSVAYWAMNRGVIRRDRQLPEHTGCTRQRIRP